VSEPQREARRRKELGAWYTPEPLVEAVVREALFPGAVSVLDPACGDGRFLRATGLPEQTGVDIDPTTEYEHDDALRRDWGDRRFDVVIGNPPFLNQLATLTSRGGRSKFGGGPYADAAAEFLALAVRLARPGGRVGLVLPQSLLSTRDARAIRAEVDRVAALRWMWWTDSLMFDANVRVWAGVWEVGGTPGEVCRAYGPEFEPRPRLPMPGTWSGLIAGGAIAPHDGPVLGDIAAFTSDFRDQYYGLVGAVGDDVDGPPLVTSGLIDFGVCHWGSKPVRFAKQRYAAPRVALERLSPALQRWAALRLVPKILIANQTSTVEAVHDIRGEWLPGVPVITCVTDEPERVMAVLGSPRTNEWVHHHAAGSGLGVGTVRLNPRLLASVPLF
jgi:SAM-dependent methyltransferase